MDTNETAALAAKLDALEAELAESYAALELALEDVGWRRLSLQATQEFSREGLRQMAELCRLMALKNPLISRACAVQRNYVFGQGVTATAADPQLNAVLQAWWTDPKNQAALTSHQELQQRDTDLMTDGNLFLALFTNPTTGRVRVRLLPTDEIGEIITDPDDARTPRYYLRSWTATTVDPTTGAPMVSQETAYYPDWRYTPRTRPATIGRVPVLWDAPVYHVAPRRVGRWGVPEVYSAIDWARAYREFLEDWATFTRSLSRFAAKMTTPGGKKGVQAAKAKLASTLTTAGTGATETNPPPVAGSTLIGAEGYSYEPIRIGGANVSMDDGRRLLLMVAAGVGLPETFFGDASVGTLATAQSLDRPTELAMQNRQKLHGDLLLDITEYAIRKAATSPRGPLRGLVRKVERVYDADDGTVTETVLWRDGVDPAITISFPPVVAINVQERMGALTAGRELLPDSPEQRRLFAQLALEALGVAEIDSILEAMADALDREPAPPTDPTSDPGAQPDAGAADTPTDPADQGAA